MPKVTFKSGEQIAVTVPFKVSNARLFGQQESASATAAKVASPFDELGFEPDKWKAYIEFEICHSLPNVIGPVMEGNYIAYTPQTLAMSHGRPSGGLIHQQVNLRHLIKAYDPKNISRDRIIGCVVATWFPKMPNSGWSMTGKPADAPAIRALAVVWKLAEGVNGMLGQHLASRQNQSVSIESITGLDNIGLWRASQPDTVVPLLDPGELESCISRGPTGNLKIGQYQGEQVVMIYGTGAPVDFRGVGVTPKPAEATAKIVAINAEEGELHAIAAERVDEQILGQEIVFGTGARGVVREVVTKGKAWGCGGFSMAASAQSPVMRVELVGSKRIVLKRLAAD